MALRAYARHRGTSVQAVLRAIKSGRLKDCLVYDVAGKAKIGDAAIADAEWSANTDLSRAPGYVKERAASPPSPVKPAPAVAAPPAQMAPTGAAKPAVAGPPDRAPAPAPERPLLEAFDMTKAMTLTDASAREKQFKAGLAELELRQKLGELVDAKEVQDRIANDYTIVRTKLLGVPGKVRTRAPHLSVSDIAIVEAEIREALEQLATETPAEGAA
jgi:hypothetical protein